MRQASLADLIQNQNALLLCPAVLNGDWYLVSPFDDDHCSKEHHNWNQTNPRPIPRDISLFNLNQTDQSPIPRDISLLVKIKLIFFFIVNETDSRSMAAQIWLWLNPLDFKRVPFNYDSCCEVFLPITIVVYMLRTQTWLSWAVFLHFRMWCVSALSKVGFQSKVSAVSKVEGRLVLGWEDKDGKDVAVSRVAAVPVFPTKQKYQIRKYFL